MATESNSACREPQRTNEISQSPLPTGDSQILPNLPCEIIVEILLRLPVKSLLRLICVCKSWRSLISNPKFAKTHLSLASMKTDYTHHRLILTNWYLEVNHVKSCSLYSILNENSDSAVDLDCPLKAPKHSVMVWGCCDGLMCIGNGRQVFLWNPSTRKYKGLPIVEEPYPICVKFGFGYDECLDDYKVVGFFFENYTRGSEPQVKVNMYALRSNSWRRIGDCPDRLPPNAWTFVNRALHWISTKSDRIIFSLDLVKETYGEVSEPEYRGGYCDDFSLGVLNGCLCILSSHFVCFDVWVMKEYGIRDSWTKLVVIPSVSHPRGYEYTAALCILKNGEVLLDFVTHLIRYNPENGTFIYPVIRNCSPRFVAYTVIESLVSLDSDADSGVPWQHHY